MTPATMDAALARGCLQQGDFKSLFIEALGWDRQSGGLDLTVQTETFRLIAVAQKRGMVAYWLPARAGSIFPAYALRRKIEQQVAKTAAHEHLIIFTDTDNARQIWQWVKREAGKPIACREHTYLVSQSGDALLQKLQAIVFSLDEEDRVTLVDVTLRARAGFDVERVTKRFYERFKEQHALFLKFV